MSEISETLIINLQHITHEISPHSRYLNPYENMLMGANVGVVVFFDAEITKSDIKEAYKLAREEHPFFRLCVKKNPKNDQNEWVEIDDYKSALIPIKFTEIDEKEMDSSTDNQVWKQNIINLTAETRELSKSMVYLTLASNKAMNKHILYAAISHAGTDGPGCFSLMESLMYNLGQVLKYKKEFHFSQCIASQLKPRCKYPFQDIVNDILTMYTKSPDKYKMPKLSEKDKERVMAKPGSRISIDEIKSSDDQSVKKTKIFGNWIEFSKEDTQLILNKCRAHKTTIQGILSCASMVAQAYRLATIDNKDKNIFPALMTIACPCQMSQRVIPKIDKMECVHGSCAILWNQEIDLEMKLWDIATKCKKELEESFNNGCCFEWLTVLNGKHETIKAPPKDTVMSSTLGINPIQSMYGDGNVIISDVKMMGSAPSDGLPQAHAGDMVHMHTFNGRLNASVTYCYPGVPHQEGKIYSDMHVDIFKAMIDEKGGDDVKVKDFIKL